MTSLLAAEVREVAADLVVAPEAPLVRQAALLAVPVDRVDLAVAVDSADKVEDQVEHHRHHH